jgi:hypothetical protein
LCFRADETGPSTPLNAGSRVHAWVRVASGTASGVPVEDAPSVQSESHEEGGCVVYAADGLGRRLGSATVDGVIRSSAPVASAAGELLDPLVEHIVAAPSLKLGALLCYGDDSAGRADSLLGADNLLVSTVQKILAAPGGGYTLHMSTTLVAMELLYDLFDPSVTPNVNETQFSGLHLDHVAWRPVASASAVTPLMGEVQTARDKVLAEHGAGLSSRSATIIALRYAPADGSAYGNTLYMIELAAPAISRASGVSGLSLDDYCSINTSLKTLTKCVSRAEPAPRSPPALARPPAP